MTVPGAGPLVAALLALATPAGAAAGVVEVLDAAAETAAGAGGDPLLRLEVADGQGWCLSWNHSVTGGAVADCFRLDGGRMILTRSFLHDFAAGLGEVPGRGRLRPAEGGGYWIEGIDEAIADAGLRLRVGAQAVDHRLTGPGWEVRLSALLAGRAVILRAAGQGPAPRSDGE